MLFVYVFSFTSIIHFDLEQTYNCVFNWLGAVARNNLHACFWCFVVWTGIFVNYLGALVSFTEIRSNDGVDINSDEEDQSLLPKQMTEGYKVH